MRDTFMDLETYCPRPLKDGVHQYAEDAEVMLWSWADGDGQVYVWDLVNGSVHWQDDLSGLWQSEEVDLGPPPPALYEILRGPDALVWFQNGGMFDMVVLQHAMPQLYTLVDFSRWRDTMVQAFAHSLPGALDKLGEVLNIDADKRKKKRGKALVQMFCRPNSNGERNTKQSHPAEWQEFIEYAGQDIVVMREAHRLMPMWNYKGKQIELWHADLRMNSRGFAVDIELAQAAVRAAETTQKRLAKETSDATGGEVQSANQRDALLAHILSAHGVDLPDMRADTLERRLNDPELPDEVKVLILIRLQASMNSVSKFKTLLKGVSSDGRLRGCQQFRGAGRTGRWGHRMFQPGNLPRTWLKQYLIELAIEWLKEDQIDAIHLAIGDLMPVMSNTIRGVIVAPPGKKLVIADLSNIEGRGAAWLAGEEWKLQAFRDFDAGLGSDLYILAYAKSFNVAPETVPEKGPERQIGKVEELMFQYGGGVGAWITGAATYGIDLDKMTAQVLPVLPEWAVLEARDYLAYLYRVEDDAHQKRYKAALKKHGDDVPQEVHGALLEKWSAAKIKARHNLAEDTFVACDAIKRTWRRAHPMISSYWKELENTVRKAIETPGVTYPCRKVKVRRDGAWLRIALPSGRCLCYPNPGEDDQGLFYTGFNQYTRQWGKVYTYGGKFFEQLTQGVACDQFAEPMPAIEAAGFDIILGVHDEWAAEVDADSPLDDALLSELMCSDLGWNAGLPLAAKGFETTRYKKE